MKQITLADAQTQLSQLVAEVEAGAVVEITRDGQIVAVISGKPLPKKIDIESLRAHQAKFTSPPQSSEEFLREWKDDARY